MFLTLEIILYLIKKKLLFQFIVHTTKGHTKTFSKKDLLNVFTINQRGKSLLFQGESKRDFARRNVNGICLPNDYCKVSDLPVL